MFSTYPVKRVLLWGQSISNCDSLEHIIQAATLSCPQAVLRTPLHGGDGAGEGLRFLDARRGNQLS